VKRHPSWSLLLLVSGTAVLVDAQAARPTQKPSREAVTVTSASKSLDVRVEPLAPEAIQIRVTNHSARAVLALDFSAFRAGERIVTDRRRAARNEALVLPHDEYVFDLPGTFDRFIVTSVLWDDGHVDGDPGLSADERVLDLGKAGQIRRVLKLLRDYRDLSGRQTFDELRGRMAALPVTSDVPAAKGAHVGMQLVKEAVLQDLAAFERAQPSPNTEAWRGWLDQTTGAYEDWLARIAAR
jgi:hypothetical protein